MAGTAPSSRLVRLMGSTLAVTFAVVGLVFLVIPGKVLAAFNWLARGIDWPVWTVMRASAMRCWR